MTSTKILRQDNRHLTRAYDAMKERHQREENLAFAAYSNPIDSAVQSFADEVHELLGKDAYHVSVSSRHVTVQYVRFVGQYPYQSRRDIASINLIPNGYNKTFLPYAVARKDGATMGTHLSKFQRDVTPARFVRWIKKNSFSKQFKKDNNL